MPSSRPASTHYSSHHAIIAPLREPNIHAPLQINGGKWMVFEPRAVRFDDAFEVVYSVQMQLVEELSSNHFDVSVHIFWEALYDSDFVPGPDILFGIARNLIREHFSVHRYSPRFSGHRFGVQLRWPELDDVTDSPR